MPNYVLAKYKQEGVLFTLAVGDAEASQQKLKNKAKKNPCSAQYCHPSCIIYTVSYMACMLTEIV